MSTKYADMSSDQKNGFWEMYFATRDTLRFSIVDLEVAAHNAELSSNAAAILAEKMRLESELVRLQNDSTAVAAGNAEVTPPSPEEITAVKQLADQVDRLTATAETYGRVVDLADEALKAYGKIRSA